MKFIIGLMLLVANAQAAWVGKLDLNSSVQAMVLREINDGQWLAGVAHPNLWHLDHNDHLILHVGMFNAYNAEGGNGSLGALVGLDLTGISSDLGLDIPSLISQIGAISGVPTIFKPAALFASFLSVDTFVGYRPVHTSDVNGNLVYGGAACLKIPFGIKELQAGL